MTPNSHNLMYYMPKKVIARLIAMRNREFRKANSNG